MESLGALSPHHLLILKPCLPTLPSTGEYFSAFADFFPDREFLNMRKVLHDPSLLACNSNHS
jgi:hypothetical protein